MELDIEPTQVRAGRRRRLGASLVAVLVGAIALTGCLSMPGNLAGTARNTDGAALSGIVVTLFDGDDEVLDTTLTDGAGAYEFVDVGPGYDFKISMHDPSGAYFDWWHAGAWALPTATSIAVGDGATTIVDGTLINSATDAWIGGVVTDAGTSDPVAGLSVAILTPGSGHVLWTTTTDVDGSYLVQDLSPGDYLVRFGGLGYGTTYNGGARSIGTAVPIELAAAEGRVDVDASVATAGAITGSVQDGSGGVSLGGGIPGLVVVAAVREDLEHPVAQATTGPNGDFTLGGLPPGELIIGFVDPVGLPAGIGFATATFGTPLEVDPAGATGVVVQAGQTTDPGLITATGLDCTADRFPGGNQPATVSGLDLGGARLAGCSFGIGAAGVGTDLVGADLDRAFGALGDFSGADLAGARLSDATFVSITFTDADFTEVDARGVTFSMFGTLTSTFAGADFTGADLTGAYFGGTDLSTTTWADTTCPDGTNSDANGGTCVGHT